METGGQDVAECAHVVSTSLLHGSYLGFDPMDVGGLDACDCFPRCAFGLLIGFGPACTVLFVHGCRCLASAVGQLLLGSSYAPETHSRGERKLSIMRACIRGAIAGGKGGLSLLLVPG